MLWANCTGSGADFRWLAVSRAVRPGRDLLSCADFALRPDGPFLFEGPFAAVFLFVSEDCAVFFTRTLGGVRPLALAGPDRDCRVLVMGYFYINLPTRVLNEAYNQTWVIAPGFCDEG